MPKPTREEMIALTRTLTDQGKLVEAGWAGLCYFTMPANAGEEQIEDMRRSFFCGAHHVFSSVFSILEAGDEATENDLARITKIHDELARFEVEMRKLAPEFRPGRMN